MQPLVLLVEDTPELGIILASLGRRGGYTVVCRPDVAGAWVYLEQAVPDLVLLDRQLPGEDGLTLCRRARGTPRLAGLAVALFGHWGLPADVAAALEAGVDFVVSKDLVARPEAFQRRLAEILPPARGQAAQRPLGWTVQPTPAAVPAPSEGVSADAGGWVARLHGALRSPALRPLGPEVLRLLLGRALVRAFPGEVKDASAAVLPDGRTLAPERVPARASPEILARLAGALAEQVWCLLGSEAGAPFAEALAAVAPGSLSWPGPSGSCETSG
jgi:two-component system OmpR family response regulator